jgi:hypothetical protein
VFTPFLVNICSFIKIDFYPVAFCVGEDNNTFYGYDRVRPKLVEHNPGNSMLDKRLLEPIDRMQ